MRYYLIAGEASGDMHGANLIKGILQHDPTAEFRFWGGDKMQAVCGNTPVKHIKDLAFMGFLEVVNTYLLFSETFRFAKPTFYNTSPMQ